MLYSPDKERDIFPVVVIFFILSSLGPVHVAHQGVLCPETNSPFFGEVMLAQPCFFVHFGQRGAQTGMHR